MAMDLLLWVIEKFKIFNLQVVMSSPQIFNTYIENQEYPWEPG